MDTHTMTLMENMFLLRSAGEGWILINIHLLTCTNFHLFIKSWILRCIFEEKMSCMRPSSLGTLRIHCNALEHIFSQWGMASIHG